MLRRNCLGWRKRKQHGSASVPEVSRVVHWFLCLMAGCALHTLRFGLENHLGVVVSLAVIEEFQLVFVGVIGFVWFLRG